MSQRQLRYWEKKGYIKPISDDNSGVRRYNLSTLYLIVFIKEQLDNGFTLAAAFERSKDIKLKSKIVRTFLNILSAMLKLLMQRRDMAKSI